MYDQEDLIEHTGEECNSQYLAFFPSVRCKDNITGTFNLLPVYSNSIYNTRYAKGLNDGAPWQGRGLNSTIGFGFSGKVGRLTYVINPILHYAENRHFYIGDDLSNRPDYQYPYLTGIDYVMRYGEDPIWGLYPGQSEVSLNLNPVEISLSTQNMKWGPGIYNPIIMSTNAAGMPHLRVGTYKPIKTAIGDVEANIFWGLMRESDYYNNDPVDEFRYFSALNLGYQPSFFDGLTIGLHRVFYAQENYLTEFFYDGFIVFSQLFSEGNDRMVEGRMTNDYYDQIMSVSFDWKDPNSDFNIYAEWARGDFAGNFVALMEQYERQSGYMFGLHKNFHINSNSYIRFIYEHTGLAVWKGDSFNSKSGGFYTHSINKQGYTNNGQVMGAFVGPGAQADMLNVAYLWDDYIFTFEYQRARYNDDYFYTTYKTMGGPTPQDIEHQLGFRFAGRYKNMSYNIGSFIGVRDNYLFEDEIVMVNVHSNISLRYNF